MVRRYEVALTRWRHLFSGKERDSETNLDYFSARYFSGAQGRFSSADDPLIDQSPSDPQSWNLYAYVRNNPLKNIELTGQDCLYTGTYDAKSNSMAYERGSCSQQGGTYVAGTIDLSSVKVDTNSNTIDYAYSTYNPSAGGGYSFGSTGLPDPGIQALQRGTMLAASAVGPLFDATMAFVQFATARFLIGPMPEDYGPPTRPQVGAPRTPDPQRPSGVPANWKNVPDTKGKGGFKYADPITLVIAMCG